MHGGGEGLSEGQGPVVREETESHNLLQGHFPMTQRPPGRRYLLKVPPTQHNATLGPCLQSEGFKANLSGNTADTPPLPTWFLLSSYK